ncbi:hypothetical protein DPMN_033996 [Dreissena polymorpha]|uniref:PHD-type domain-containing protein n=1 Tax=Dreissena polymorpha TaxID=45954 RepID=A0A9D4M9D3_DREPO|nr:hypothetical protein DPMN_033996 [Dreissena polymorpha]
MPQAPSNRNDQVKSHEHSYSIVDENKCSLCDYYLEEKQASMQCELCDSWLCLICAEVTQTFYDELNKDNQGDNCIWYCNGCKKVIPCVRKVLNVVSAMKKSQDEINSCLEIIESKIQEVGANCELSMDFKVDQALYDQRERDERKNNIIMYNIPESNAQTNEDKQTEDDVKIRQECEFVENQENCQPTKIKQNKRLGEIQRGPKARPRPMKVVLERELEKVKFLRNGEKLKNSEYKVHVTPDYTRRQRELNNKMKNEVANRREQDPLFTYRKLKDELYGRSRIVGNSNDMEGSENGSNEILLQSRQPRANGPNTKIPIPT